MDPARASRALAYAWVAVLSVVIVGPALWPGFALSYDLVFTPRQDLLPGTIGVGGGLPRAVPQDAVVALIGTIVPGSIVEKVALLAVPLLVGAGMLRLLPGTVAGVVAATIAIANPFVAQRLVQGHWGLLLAYALVPWALHVVRRLRQAGDPWDGVRLLLIVAAGSLTPSGSVLLSTLTVPAALLPGSAYSAPRRALLALAVAATWLPWALPALMHGSGGAGDSDGAAVFAWRPDMPGGVLPSLLTGGGIWNAEVISPLRQTGLSLVFAAFALGLAAWGWGRLRATLGHAVTAWWTGVAVLGLVAALVSHAVPGAWSGLVEAVPGGGLARDSHKLLAPWVLLVAAAAGMGARRVAGLGRDRATRAAVAAILVVLPVAAQPDLAWGVGGRLSAVAYPSDWASVRQILEADSRSGDVVSLPWTSFRRFPWNENRTVLDPAPRWMPRTTVVADDLAVQRPVGIVTISGDDPRARAVTEALDAGESPASVLPGLGVGWALVALDSPGPIPDLRGWRPVFEGATLALYEAPRQGFREVTPDTRLVAAVDCAVLGALVAVAVALGVRSIRRVRVRSGRSLVP